jgi:hypothetical protein
MSDETPAMPLNPDQQLTIGELFPHDDLIAQWVFSLTAFTEDLHVGLRPSQEAMKEGDLRAILFWHRHMVTRLYEARRLVTTARDEPNVRAFVGDLLQRPPGGADLIQAYTRPAKGQQSTVERMYEDLRHLTVHYSKVGTAELENTLNTYAFLPAEIILTAPPEGLPDVAFGWVQAVRSMEVLGDIRRADFLAELRASGEITAGLAASWIMVSLLAVFLHTRRLGIDTNRLGDVSAWKPPEAD